MRHGYNLRKLGRTSSHRRAMLRNIVTAFLRHGKIKTTLAKAEELRPIAEKMVTLGKRGDLHARRQALSFIFDKDVVHHLFSFVSPKFQDRNGGYTRIIKAGFRHGDAAEMAYIQFVESDKNGS